MRAPRLFEAKGDPASGAPAARSESTVAEERDRALVCAACGAAVAKERDRVEVFGANEHDRMNPSGYLFRIACFARADGALAVGLVSDEFPWFPRHTWRIAVCRSCGVHLGWLFAAGSASFFGLIVDKLREAGD